MKENYVTITGSCHYYGLKPFAIGHVIRCQKEPSNAFDSEAIRCSLPMIGTVGYVANSPRTTAGGTMSAGRVYDRVGRRFYLRVLFTTSTKVICRVEQAHPEELEEQIRAQMEENWNDGWDEEEPLAF